MKSLSKLYPCFLFAALLLTACQKKAKEDILPAQATPKEIAANHQALLKEIQKSGPQKAGFIQLSTSEYAAHLKKSSKSKINEKTIAFLDEYNIYKKGETFCLSKKDQSEARAESVLGFSAGYNMNSGTCYCDGSLANINSQTFDDRCTREGASGGLLNLSTLGSQSSHIMYSGTYAAIIDNVWLELSGVLTITWSFDVYGLYFNYTIGYIIQPWINQVNS